MQQLQAVIWLIVQVCMVISAILLISRMLASKLCGLEEMEARAGKRSGVDWQAYRAWHDKRLHYAMMLGLLSSLGLAAVTFYMYFAGEYYPEAKAHAGHTLIGTCFFSFLLWLNPWRQSRC